MEEEHDLDDPLRKIHKWITPTRMSQLMGEHRVDRLRLRDGQPSFRKQDHLPDQTAEARLGEP